MTTTTNRTQSTSAKPATGDRKTASGGANGNGRNARLALGAAAAVAATAAGIATVKKLRASGNGHAVWEVKAHADGWQLCRENAGRPTRVFETKKEAVQAAREHAASHAPSELRIYTGDDRLLDRHSYEAASPAEA